MPTPTVFALDFDGVLCDSAAETCAAAWRAGRVLWSGWEAPEPPPAWVSRFRELRPVLETGYQAIALLRLVEQEFTPSSANRSTVIPPPRHPATPLNAVTFAEIGDRIFAGTGLGKAELVRIFGEARDTWIAAEPEAWLARHEFYPGVAAALNTAIARGCPLFILTTKQQRFTERLLHNFGADLPSDHIFGLETQRSKDEILKELMSRPECRGLRMVFVEDRLEALERAAGVPELAAVELRLATWGYCGEVAKNQSARPEQVRIARIRSWTLAEFTAVLAGCPQI